MGAAGIIARSHTAEVFPMPDQVKIAGNLGSLVNCPSDYQLLILLRSSISCWTICEILPDALDVFMKFDPAFFRPITKT